LFDTSRERIGMLPLYCLFVCLLRYSNLDAQAQAIIRLTGKTNWP